VEDQFSETFEVKTRDSDAYSMSVYTDNILELKIAQAPQLPSPPLTVATSSPNELYDNVSVPYHSTRSSPSRSSSFTFSSSQHSWKTASTGRSRPPHEGAELTFQAYDNWKDGVVSRIKMESRAIAKQERERLASVQPIHSNSQPSPWKLLLLMVRKVMQSNRSVVLFSEGGRDRRVTVVC